MGFPFRARTFENMRFVLRYYNYYVSSDFGLIEPKYRRKSKPTACYSVAENHATKDVEYQKYYFEMSKVYIYIYYTYIKNTVFNETTINNTNIIVQKFIVPRGVDCYTSSIRRKLHENIHTRYMLESIRQLNGG